MYHFAFHKFFFIQRNGESHSSLSILQFDYFSTNILGTRTINFLCKLCACDCLFANFKYIIANKSFSSFFMNNLPC